MHVVERSPVSERHVQALWYDGALRPEELHTVDTKRFVLVDGRRHTTPLSVREVQLLRHFVDHPGEVATRDDLLNLYWGYDYGGVTRTVDQHVAVLRKKLGSDGDRIETVPRIGYRFVK